MKSKKAEEYIKADLNIFCCNKKEWETDELEILPSGDFIDNKRRVHSKENHIPFVNYYKCVEAIQLAEEEMKEKVTEEFRHFLEDYCHEAGIKMKDTEHYIEVFTNELNK